MVISLALILAVAIYKITPLALFGLLITWLPDIILILSTVEILRPR